MSRIPRLLVASVSALVLASGSLVIAPAPSLAATSVPRFLSLPFQVTRAMRIQQGHIWQGPPQPGHLHGGIDYIKGRLDRSRTWKTFPVYAAATGYACANLTGRKGCIVGNGNRVLITHNVKGRRYRTYYGHLEAISTRIPMGGRRTVLVKRGELIGYAGYSGDPCCVRHLHFQLFDPQWKTVDPYGIDSTRGDYPDPAGSNGIRNGRRSYWREDPPVPPSSFTKAPVRDIPYTSPKPERTPRPEPTRTPRPKPERTPRPTRRPERTPLSTATPTPELRPPPSLVATTARTITWWTQLITDVLHALRGAL